MKTMRLPILMIISAAVLVPGWLQAHVSNPLLPEGCGSCHVGHGIEDEPMLSASEEDACYQCHGSEEKQSAMKSAGKLAASAVLADMESEFRKTYRHPVEDRSGHSPTEKLPSITSGSVDHAECVDCHNPHQRIQLGPKQTYDVQGYSLSGQYLETSTNEFEICLKCHSESTGLTSSTSRNMLREFSVSVVSQHPVTKITSASRSVSLSLSGPQSGALMKCSDCHTNDDPDGPRGPHASNHKFLLSGNYDTDIYANESPFAYEFCYSCHERTSILSNESFPLHREHIEGDPLSGVKGTSCFTCHASHSSQSNSHLIEFNRAAVSRDRQTGRIDFIEMGERAGECYLSCHGHNHSPGKY